MAGAGAILEPLVVIVLLFGGTWINRSTSSSFSSRPYRRRSSSLLGSRDTSPDSIDSGLQTPSAKDGLIPHRSSLSSAFRFEQDPIPWRKRQVGFFSWTADVTSPNTAVFQDRLLSRLLRKLPFLVECWYWALVYWVRKVFLNVN